MNGYLASIIGTVLLCAVLTAILPQGKTSGLIKGIAKLACVLVIVSPVLHFFKTGEIGGNSAEDSFTFFPQTGIQTDESFIHYYSEMRVRETETLLKSELLDRYAVETEVTLLWEEETEQVGKYYESERIKINQIHIKCEEEPSKELKENMWEYLTKNYCSEVLIE
ncbi:MAG: hypothetical protein E7352_00720 [Clostridiales bacterium]|nr:hypothetical protein [Clostridiales bacterium]